MRPILFFFVFLCCCFTTLAQDLIVLKNGDEIKAKILKQSNNIIDYRIFDDMTGTVFQINKEEVLFVKYSDGRQVVMNTNDSNINTDTNKTQNTDNISAIEIRQIAVADARDFYTASGAAWATGCVTALNPGIGIPTGAIFMVIKPKDINLNMPPKYKNNELYNYTYKKEAYKLKKKRILWGAGVGILLWVLVLSYTESY